LALTLSLALLISLLLTVSLLLAILAGLLPCPVDFPPLALRTLLPGILALLFARLLAI